MLIGASRDVCHFVEAHDVIVSCIRQLPFTSVWVKARAASGVMYKETTTAFSSSSSHVIRIWEVHGLNPTRLPLFCPRLSYFSSIPPNKLPECTLKQVIAGSFSFCVLHFTWAWRACQYSHSLWAGRPGDRIPIGAKLYPSRLTLVSTWLPV